MTKEQENADQLSVQNTGPNPWGALLTGLVLVGVVVAFSIMYPRAMRGIVIGVVVLLCLGISLAFLAWVWDRVYPRAVMLQHDKDALRKRQLVVYHPDRHGFAGHGWDLASNTMTDLDTGESFVIGGPVIREPSPERIYGRIKRGLVAALTGANLQQSATPLIEGAEEKPGIALPGQGGDGPMPWFEIAQDPYAEIEE